MKKCFNLFPFCEDNLIYFPLHLECTSIFTHFSFKKFFKFNFSSSADSIFLTKHNADSVSSSSYWMTLNWLYRKRYYFFHLKGQPEFYTTAKYNLYLGKQHSYPHKQFLASSIQSVLTEKEIWMVSEKEFWICFYFQAEEFFLCVEIK